MSEEYCAPVGCFSPAYSSADGNILYFLEPRSKPVLTLPPVEPVAVTPVLTLPPVEPVAVTPVTLPPVLTLPPVEPVPVLTLPPVEPVPLLTLSPVEPVAVTPAVEPLAVTPVAVIPASSPMENDIVVYLTKGTLKPDQTISIQHNGEDVPFRISPLDYMMGRASLQSAGCSPCGCGSTASPPPYNRLTRYYR